MKNLSRVSLAGLALVPLATFAQTQTTSGAAAISTGFPNTGMGGYSLASYAMLAVAALTVAVGIALVRSLRVQGR